MLGSIMATKKKIIPLRRRLSPWIIVERRGFEWPSSSTDFETRPEAEEASKTLASQHNGTLHVIPKSASYANKPPAKKRRLRRDVRRNRR